ncbi:putative ABC transporter ATP-binding protein YxlF [compost metagenome]
MFKNERGIQGISLAINEGDIYGLLGPNGAGKTTFLKLITGLIHPDQGMVCLFGTNSTGDWSHGMRHVGCMIESADFHDFLTPWQYLRQQARFYPGIGAAQIQEVLEQVGLYQVRKEKIRGFSTGMKQKLALAAAVLPKPDLVILDEPTNGLDIEGTVVFRKLIKQLSEEDNTSFLISSHMIHELEQLCNRVGIIVGGKLAKEGSVSELLQSNESLEQFYISQLELLRKGDQHCA